jgi:hypothetical protein
MTLGYQKVPGRLALRRRIDRDVDYCIRRGHADKKFQKLGCCDVVGVIR